MSLNTDLDRRAFLKSAGMIALVGAVGSGTAEGVVASSAVVQPPQSQFDFDTVYNRIGTDCSK